MQCLYVYINIYYKSDYDRLCTCTWKKTHINKNSLQLYSVHLFFGEANVIFAQLPSCPAPATPFFQRYLSIQKCTGESFNTSKGATINSAWKDFSRNVSDEDAVVVVVVVGRVPPHTMPEINSSTKGLTNDCVSLIFPLNFFCQSSEKNWNKKWIFLVVTTFNLIQVRWQILFIYNMGTLQKAKSPVGRRWFLECDTLVHDDGSLYEYLGGSR